MEEGNDEHVQQVEEILAAKGGALDWGRLTNLATEAGIKLPQLKKLKRLPGFSGGGETKKPINPRNQGVSPLWKPLPGMYFEKRFLGITISRTAFLPDMVF